MRRVWRLTIGTGVAAAIVAAGLVTARSASPKFYDDDPLTTEPETQDASGVQEWDIDLFYDLSYNLFVKPDPKVPAPRAQNVNTIDEVPDSSWFTNRILARAISAEELMRGPTTGQDLPPGIKATVISPKTAGFAPGFVAREPNGEVGFVSFDPPGNPEAATGAVMVANRIFWALGYWQVENYLGSIRLEDITVAESAMIKTPSGERRQMTLDDVKDVLERSARNADGSYRFVAGRALQGRPVGGFKYIGTRPDDPNDLVPHEHRRELRALKVFGAWTNLVDMKAGNTLDSVVKVDGRSVVRHYLQDVGSTFGIGANGPREWDEGWEYIYEGDPTWKRLVTLGFYRSPWQRADYTEYPAIGRFEGDEFDPEAWKSRVPARAVLMARDDDTFWAARRVMAFTDDMLRAVVKVAKFSNANAEQYLADVLIKRRDKIGRAYLPKVNPLVDFALDAGGTLTFENAAVQHKVAEAPRGGYRATWASFDNATGTATAIGVETRSPAGRMSAPSSLPAAPGAYVKIEVSAIDPPHSSWTKPLHVYFKRAASGWTLVGLERIPEGS